MTVYDFSAKDDKGNLVRLSTYKGQVLLIVNTATRCGLTPQYEALEALYQKYQGQGFVVLDFPSNQFLKQAPGTAEEINEFCTLRYSTTFPRFAKIDVNGKDADPLFAWLKEQAPEDDGDGAAAAFAQKVKLLKPFAKPGDIKWNFGKFLVDRRGNVAGRYSPAYTPDKLEQAVAMLLADNA